MKDLALEDLQKYVTEAKFAAYEWRHQSWTDEEFYDGLQWSTMDEQDAIDKGVDPMTINRIFPVVNLILGSQVINKLDITAKGRTQKDGDTSETMTECIKFISDQYSVEYLVSQAFRGAIVPGIDYLYYSHNSDPRREKLRLRHRKWREIWSDPFGDPWLDPDACRYVYAQRWMDVEDLIALYPNKQKDIYEAHDEYSSSKAQAVTLDDEEQFVEEYKQILAGSYSGRKRVRPVEMWYVKHEKGLFAKFADGTVIDLNPKHLSSNETVNAAMAAQEIIVAMVPRIKTCVFLGDLEIFKGDSPYYHDRYPFIPFIGYLDRFGFPYGVPRQLRGENIEINKRRSMALQLLRTRRVIIEADAVPEGGDLQNLYNEANKPDGFLVVRSGTIGSQKIKIQENAEMSKFQYDILMQSEQEIQQISGANDELMGYKGQSVSGVAIERRQAQGNTVTATLFENLRRSLKITGDILVPEIQGNWKKEKVLRITDRIRGTDKFITINQMTQGPQGELVIRNNITQGKYDIVVTDTPLTDTIREKNLDLIIEWIKKSPPEIIPHLMNMAFEMSNLPNKEQLLARMKPVLGINPLEEDMTPEQIKAQTIQMLEEQKKAQAEAAQIEREGVLAEIESKKAQTAKVLAETEAIKRGVKLKKDQQELEGFKTGYQIQKDIHDKVNGAQTNERKPPATQGA